MLLGDSTPSNRLYLVGAGISIDEPSGVLSVPVMLDLIFRRMERKEGPARQQYLDRASIPPPHNPFGALRFETVIQALTELVPEMRDVLPLMAEHGEPNDCHRFLAQELAQGASVLTTNFDCRIEEACRRQNLPCDPFVLSSRCRVPTQTDRFIKLHGSFGGGAAPRATLLDVGMAGLGYASFPGLRRWLRARADQCDLIVMGYSASDHFDVVPLIEEVVRPRRVFWMDFQPTARAVRWRRFSSAQGAAIPRRRTLESPSVLLDGLAARNENAEIWRARASSTAAFVRSLTGRSAPRAGRDVERAASAELRNRKTLKRRLRGLRIGAYERSEFAKMLLEEDPFGGYLGVDFEKGSEADSAERGKGFFEAAEREVRRYGLDGAKARLAKLEAGPGSPRQHADYVAKRYHYETQGEDDAAMFEAAKALVGSEVRRGVYSQFRGNELLQMMLEDIFEGALLRRNVDVMCAIRDHLSRMFRSTGQIGAGVQAYLMDAQIRRRQFIAEASPSRYVPLVRKGLKAAESAAYYGLRTGRDDVIEKASWLYAFFLETTGARREALAVLTNYVDWIASGASETTGVTLTNVAMVAARHGDPRTARRYLRRVKALSPGSWMQMPIFVASIEAQISAVEGRERSARRWIRNARRLVDEIAPDDPWRQREELAFLEQELDRKALVQ